jgi:CRP-like cAMP-binding protein
LNALIAGVLMSIQSLLASFERYLPLDQDEERLVAERVQKRVIKRRHMILQEGDVCRHYSFVVQGCLRLYAVGKKGTEHNLQFAAEQDWITDLDSFYSETPSNVYIDALESSVILQINKEDLVYLFVNLPKFDRNFRVIIEEKFIDLQERVLLNISSSAEERYLAFLQRYPHLSTRLANTQIASYLGITPEFLSKVRKDLSHR